MKTILSALAIAVGSTVLAVESSNTFGILRIDSSASQTIVSVPWLASGGGNINVADVVKTANLNPGDKLYYYSTGTTNYRVWQLSQTGVWEEAVPAGESATQDPTLARGNAIILERFAPQGGSLANCFYLYGQYTDANPSVACVENGYTLLAPTGLNRDCDLNRSDCCSFAGTIGENDMIYIPNANGVYSIYEYDKGKWGMWKKTFVVGATIPVGSGAWYVSKGGSPTITWKNPAAPVAQ